jgi:heat shock protein HslJ
MRRIALVLGTCLVAVGMLAACSGAGGGATPSPPPTSGPPTYGPPTAGATTSGTPASGTPATAAQLVGTWVLDATIDVPTRPFLTVVGDGTWTGSDGCNGVRGTWLLGGDGELTVEAGPSTLIYCDGKPLPRLFATAKRASVDGGQLTLVDGTGAILATLIRGREELTPLN